VALVTLKAVLKFSPQKIQQRKKYDNTSHKHLEKVRLAVASTVSAEILGSARVPRAGDGVLAIANFLPRSFTTEITTRFLPESELLNAIHILLLDEWSQWGLSDIDGQGEAPNGVSGKSDIEGKAAMGSGE
jgi:hypothetical protein